MGSCDMIGAIGRTMETNPQLARMNTPFLPVAMAEPGDIADAVLWLATDESKLVTATAMSIDQGATQHCGSARSPRRDEDQAE